MNPLLCANMFNSTKRASFFPAILSILALCYLTEAAMPRIPASVVVPRASPDVTSHKTEIPQFIFLLTFLAILMTFFMAARIYARGILRRNMGWDDWTMLAAWVSVQQQHRFPSNNPGTAHFRSRSSFWATLPTSHTRLRTASDCT